MERLCDEIMRTADLALVQIGPRSKIWRGCMRRMIMMRRRIKFSDILTDPQTDTIQNENREHPQPALCAGHTLWEQGAWFNNAFPSELQGTNEST